MNRLLALALWPAVAWAAPPSGLDPVTQAMWSAAEQAEQDGALNRAAASYSSVFQATNRPEAAVAMGRVWQAMGRARQAESAYRSAGSDRDAQVALIRLLLDQDRQAEARRVLRPLTSAYAGDVEIVWLDVMLTAPEDPERGRVLLDAWLGYAATEALEPEAAIAAAIAVYEALKQAGQMEPAAAALQRVMEVVPETKTQLDILGDRAMMEARALQLAQADARPLTVAQRERLTVASRALDRGELERAQEILDALAGQAEHSPEVLGLRANVHRAAGQFSEAERDLRLAEALDPLDARWPVAIGEVLDEAYSYRFDSVVVDAWDRGLGLQPGRADIWLKKGTVELRLAAGGDQARLAAARGSLSRAVALDGDGPIADQARRRLEDLARRRLRPVVLAGARGCPVEVSDDACRAYHLALTYHRRGLPADEATDRRADADVALDEVAIARAEAPSWVRALNLQATILRARAEALDSASDQARSLALFAESLELDANQPEIWVYLGKVQDRAGHHAAALDAWRKAIELPGSGGAAAHIYLAEEAVTQWDFMGARSHLDRYADAPASTAVQDSLTDRAEAVAAQVSAVERGVVGAGVAVAGAAVLVPAVWFWRRRRGSTVEQLLRKDPGSWRDVARIASALRHEVLKHHTSVLVAVADSLEAGDIEPAEWLGERLGGPDGPVQRGKRYLDELRELGRRAGIPLDLESRDPVFAPVCQGLDRLDRLAKPLSRGARRVVPELYAISTLLHDEAYPALGALVQRICVMELDAAVIDRCWEQVGNEPGFRGQELPSIDVVPADEPMFVRVWRDELELIVVNLLRNAAEASIEHRTTALRVSIGVEDDPVTFLERAVLRVADQAPRNVSTAMIRGRYIERGLGLTVDVISRYGGSIHVEDEPGWSKAVVVRLPRVEVVQEIS